MKNPSYATKTSGTALLFVLATVLFALILPGTKASGQTWKYHYGQVGLEVQAGYNRVTPVTGACRSAPSCTPCSTRTDGYIAVGRSGYMSSDVYVVRTDNNGLALWEFTYDIEGNGNFDVGYSIIELSDETGFVVTGWTQGTNGSRAFLMKIDCNGAPVWTQVYNAPTTQNFYQAFGYDLIEARTGNGTTTNPGDIIVCGYLTPDRSPTADALIFRTDATGGLIWNATYNNATVGGVNTDERLEKLTEASRSGGQSTGDVIAVGGAGGASSPKDAYVLRVNGNDGSIGAAPQGAATYGGTGLDYFYSVVELQNPAERGTNGPNVVLAGSYDEGGAAGGLEIYLVKLNNGDPCDPALETITGDRTTGYPELAYDIREVRIPFGTGGGGTGGGNEVEQWDLVVTGETGSLTASNNRDAFLLSVDVATLAPIFGVAHRTSVQVGASEWGRSLEIVAAVGNRTLGVIMCGEVQGTNFLSELFLVKTDVGLSTAGDCQEDFDPDYDDVDFYLDCVDPSIDDPLTEDDVTSEETERDWGTEVCIPIIKRVPDVGLSADNASAEVGGYTVRIAPNPVRSGRELTLLFEGAQIPEGVAVNVVNAAGESVAAPSGALRIGADGTAQVSVAGWNPGVYFITVIDGSHRRMLRVVVE